MKVLFLALLLCCTQFLYATDSLTFVFLNKKTDNAPISKEESDRIMSGHMANIEKMAAEGKLIVAGPFEGGGGIFIFKTGSVAKVKKWLENDPGIIAKRWNEEYLPVKFLFGNACAAKEPYEMVTYNFIRFTLNLTKFNVQHAPETLNKHDLYLKKLTETGNVVAIATFGKQEGGILIMKGELDMRVPEASPAVQEQLLQPSAKKLWIARGSFCE
jgi:uncharacterized protein YciI